MRGKAVEQRQARYLPLHGKRVLVTRPAEQAGEFIQDLRNLGAEPVLCPTIRIVPPEDIRPLQAAIERLSEYDWVIFTSVNGVRFFFEQLGAGEQKAEGRRQKAEGRRDRVCLGPSVVGSLGTGDRGQGTGDRRSSPRLNPKSKIQNPKSPIPRRLRLAAIGPATADALAGYGLPVDFVPDQYVAEAIVDGIGDVRGQRILLPRADIARRALVEGLEARGAEVHEVTAYRTLPANPGDLQSLLGQQPAIDIATFTSPSTVHNFVALLADGLTQNVLGRAVVACIGPITASAAQAEGLRVDIVAPEHTTSGLLQTIVGYFDEHEREL